MPINLCQDGEVYARVQLRSEENNGCCDTTVKVLKFSCVLLKLLGPCCCLALRHFRLDHIGYCFVSPHFWTGLKFRFWVYLPLAAATLKKTRARD